MQEEDNDLPAAIDLLRRRHVVMLANLREGAVDAVLEHEIVGFEEALAYAGASKYMADRRELLMALAGNGTVIVESTPHDLPVRVVNSYWQIKRAGTL